MKKMIRQLIREMLLSEAAITPNALPKGVKVVVKPYNFGKGGWHITVFYPDADELSGLFQKGEIKITRPLGMGKCLDAYEVGSVYANIPKLGPLLYDIAIELAGKNGLMSDRRMVSADAWKVWNYFLNNRSDVASRQLDSDPGTLTPQNDDDDCNQTSSKLDGEKDLMDLFFKKEKENDKWSESPLSKVYYKQGTPVIDELKSLGLLTMEKQSGKLIIVDDN